MADDADADSGTQSVSDVIHAARKAASAARHYAKHGVSPPKSPAIARSEREIAANQQRTVVRARALVRSGGSDSPEQLNRKPGHLPPPRNGGAQHGAPRVVVSPPSSTLLSSPRASSSATTTKRTAPPARRAGSRKESQAKSGKRNKGPLLPGASQDIMDLLK